MKKPIMIGFMITILILGSFVSKDNIYASTNNSTAYQVNWDNLFGGLDDEQVNSAIATSDGGYLAVGYSFSSASGEISDTTNGFYDGLIVKFDSKGNRVWDNLFGGADADVFTSVIQTSDGGYIAVGSSSSSASGEISDTGNGGEDGLIVKFDSKGNKVWDKLFGGEQNDSFNSIKETSDGGFIVAGSSFSSASGEISDTWNGEEDGLVVKFDSEGNKVWDNLFGGSAEDRFESVIGTSDGGYIAVGHSSASGGELTDAFNGQYDALIVKFDSDGNKVWDHLFGGVDGEWFWDVVQANDGGYITVGDRSPSEGMTNDALIIKYDSEGNKVWEKSVASNAMIFLKSVIQSSDGGYVVAGYSTSSASGDIADTGNGAQDGLIIKFDSAGNKVWDDLIGGSSTDYFESIIETNDGGYVVAGTSYSSTSGDITDTNNGSSDGLILKLKAKLYTASFDLNGGSSPQPDPQTLAEGSNLTPVDDPTWDNHTFGGWYKDKECTEVWDFTTDKMPANDITLYAKWTLIQNPGKDPSNRPAHFEAPYDEPGEPQTDDPSNPILWIVGMILAAVALGKWALVKPRA
jgi:uncharacterized repeat protein (TIGR02543 family)